MSEMIFMKTFRIKTRDAVSILRRIKQQNMKYCITQYDDDNVYLIVRSETEEQLNILSKIDDIEECPNK